MTYLVEVNGAIMKKCIVTKGSENRKGIQMDASHVITMRENCSPFHWSDEDSDDNINVEPKNENVTMENESENVSDTL